MADPRFAKKLTSPPSERVRANREIDELDTEITPRDLHLLTPSAILSLQHKIGNQAVQRLIARNSPYSLKQSPAHTIHRAVQPNLPAGTTVKVKIGSNWYPQTIISYDGNTGKYAYQIPGNFGPSNKSINYDSDDIIPNDQKNAGGNLSIYMGQWGVQKSAWTDTIGSTSFATCVGLALKAKTSDTERIGMVAHFRTDTNVNIIDTMIANLNSILPNYRDFTWTGILFRGNLDTGRRDTNMGDLDVKRKDGNMGDIAVDPVKNLKNSLLLFKRVKTKIQSCGLTLALTEQEKIGHRTLSLSLQDDNPPVLSEPETEKDVERIFDTVKSEIK